METLTRTILIELQESDEAFAYNDALRILKTAYALHPGPAEGNDEEIEFTNALTISADIAVAVANDAALEAAEVFKNELRTAGIKTVSSWGEGNEWEVVLDDGFNWDSGASAEYIIAGLAAWEVDGRPSDD